MLKSIQMGEFRKVKSIQMLFAVNFVCKCSPYVFTKNNKKFRKLKSRLMTISYFYSGENNNNNNNNNNNCTQFSYFLEF